MMPPVGQPIALHVSQWTAWCGGLTTREDCAAWIDGTAAPDPTAMPKLDFLPMLQRRRYSRLSRMALEVAHQSLTALPGAPQLVFSSRYGEYGVTFELLSALAREEALSPAAFSMSVHNTGAGICTMVEGLTGHAVAVAAGLDSLEMALLDCWMLLASGEAEDVLMVYADEPLPAAYRQNHPLPPGGLALAMRLALPATPTRPEGILTLDWTPAEAQDGTDGGGAENLLRMLLGQSTAYRRQGGRLEWSGRYHAAA